MNREELEEQIAARLRPSPRQNPALQVRRFGDDEEQPIHFYIFGDVIEELGFAASFGEEEICAAILVGGFGVEPDGGFVEVSGFDGLTHLDTLDELYPTIRETCDAWISGAGDEALVGLFVSIRGDGVRVHPEVARVHFSLFNIPFQPLIMIDPDDETLGVFARHGDTPFFEAAFRAVAATPALNADNASGTPADAEE